MLEKYHYTDEKQVMFTVHEFQKPKIKKLFWKIFYKKSNKKMEPKVEPRV